MKFLDARDAIALTGLSPESFEAFVRRHRLHTSEYRRRRTFRLDQIERGMAADRAAAKLEAA